MRYCVMIDEKLKIAVEKSDEILNELNSENRNDNEMITTKRILYVVQRCTKTTIGIGYLSFSEALKDDAVINCGAMMSVYKENDEQIADIIVNSDMDTEYQRFSLVHELGHLMTGKYNIENKGNKYKLSAHINQNVFSISEEDYNMSNFLLNEQIANVFALRVLIPFEKLMRKIEKDDNLSDIASSFGVTKEAIISRIALGK